jgi:hypothetical protein
LELYDLYFSPNIMQVIKWIRMCWSGKVACVVERRDAYRVLVRRARCRWEDNIKFDFKKWDGVTWTGLMCVGMRTGGRLL